MLTEIYKHPKKRFQAKEWKQTHMNFCPVPLSRTKFKTTSDTIHCQEESGDGLIEEINVHKAKASGFFLLKHSWENIRIMLSFKQTNSSKSGQFFLQKPAAHGSCLSAHFLCTLSPQHFSTSQYKLRMLESIIILILSQTMTKLCFRLNKLNLHWNSHAILFVGIRTHLSSVLCFC